MLDPRPPRQNSIAWIMAEVLRSSRGILTAETVAQRMIRHPVVAEVFGDAEAVRGYVESVLAHRKAPATVLL